MKTHDIIIERINDTVESFKNLLIEKIEQSKDHNRSYYVDGNSKYTLNNVLELIPIESDGLYEVLCCHIQDEGFIQLRNTYRKRISYQYFWDDVQPISTEGPRERIITKLRGRFSYISKKMDIDNLRMVRNNPLHMTDKYIYEGEVIREPLGTIYIDFVYNKRYDRFFIEIKDGNGKNLIEKARIFCEDNKLHLGFKDIPSRELFVDRELRFYSTLVEGVKQIEAVTNVSATFGNLMCTHIINEIIPEVANIYFEEELSYTMDDFKDGKTKDGKLELSITQMNDSNIILQIGAYNNKFERVVYQYYTNSWRVLKNLHETIRGMVKIFGYDLSSDAWEESLDKINRIRRNIGIGKDKMNYHRKTIEDGDYDTITICDIDLK